VITDDNIEEVQQLVHIGQRVTVITVAEESGMSKQSAVET
jgi:hypothetical protein